MLAVQPLKYIIITTCQESQFSEKLRKNYNVHSNETECILFSQQTSNNMGLLFCVYSNACWEIQTVAFDKAKKKCEAIPVIGHGGP
jgi:hypothetical protein